MAAAPLVPPSTGASAVARPVSRPSSRRVSAKSPSAPGGASPPPPPARDKPWGGHALKPDKKRPTVAQIEQVALWRWNTMLKARENVPRAAPERSVPLSL